MKEKYRKVYQFKIALRDISPLIWRRIQVPETFTFWDLHVAMQDAMGWSDCHLHRYEMMDTGSREIKQIGWPDPEFSGEREIIDERKAKIAEWFTMEDRSASYDYDYGDNWSHQIELEEILEKNEGTDYPVCMDGKRACPPEDCGGAPGYEELLEAISDPGHPEHEEITEWLGNTYDPEHFDAAEILFDDPEERWKSVSGS